MVSGFTPYAELPIADVEELGGLFYLLEDNINIGHEVALVKEASASSTLALSDGVSHVVIGLLHQPAQTIGITDAVAPCLIYVRSIIDNLALGGIVKTIKTGTASSTLTLTDSHTQVLYPQQNTSSTLNLTDELSEILFPAQHLEHDLNLIHGHVLSNHLNNHITHILDITDESVARFIQKIDADHTIGIDHVATIFNFRQWNMSHTIGINQVVSVFNLAQQDVVHTLTLSDSVTVANFEQQDLTQTIGLTHAFTHRNLPQFDGNHTIGVTDILSHYLFPAQNIVHDLDLTHVIGRNQILVLSACDCLGLIQMARTTIEESVSNTLTLSDYAVVDTLNHTIGLTHSVSTNAILGSCCDGYQAYIPDKLVTQDLELTDSVSTDIDDSISVVQSLDLLSTAAYYTV